MAVRYVNCFKVREGAEELFLERWRPINAYMTAKPGYLNDRLHRSLDPAATYRFVNYIEWESAELHVAAHDEGFRALISEEWRAAVQSTAALYEVIHEGARPN
ncbi:MAG: antibiotic biosynthesis monooxygenase family protein [Acidimicrobiales bacterium]